MLIFAFLNFICGYCKLKAEDADAERVINILMEKGIDYWALKRGSDRGLYFKILTGDLKSLCSLLDKSSIKVYIIYEKGLPFLIKKYRRRFGIPAGAVLFSLIIWLSTLYVWDIDVISADSGKYIDSRQVIKRLDELGCSVGSYIPDIDFYELCNEYLMRYDDVSWITVNLKGTVAHVELREKTAVPDITDTEKPSNIIAKYDGQIEHFEVYSGVSAVKVGEVIREGDLLISGIVDTKTNGYRLERAMGRVYANVIRKFSVSIPLDMEKKTYTGRSQSFKHLNIFGKSIKLYINDDIYINNYDKIIDEKRIILFGVIRLPITVVNEIYNEYEMTVQRLTEDEAIRIAEIKMTKLLYDELSTAEITERVTTAGFENEAYNITCDIYCIDDIGSEVAIEVKSPE